MSKINLKSVNQILSNKEMKNVLGGSGGSNCSCCDPNCHDCVSINGGIGCLSKDACGYQARFLVKMC